MLVVSVNLPSIAVLDTALVTWAISVAYILLLALVATYGLHRYWLLHLFRKHRRDRTRPDRRFAELPRVTVQLPMFNEAAVAERVIDAACRLDYPRDRLQVQVLDDSTDACAELARRRVEHWARRGVDIAYLHRPDRSGFKAGALQAGLAAASGEFVAIFDADFVPPPHFLRRAIHHFTDDGVGMVQARWAHLNRDASLLTRSQAVFLDGHFVIEHAARHRSAAWFNFNGTAGVWRRTAIDAAGGWHADTLTEDVDVSYRAQLAGWRFVYLPRLACPAELPPEMNGFKSQQHRWAKGSVQVALKLLPQILSSAAPLHVKLEAFFHLTSPLVYLWTTLLALLVYPVLTMPLQGLEGRAVGVAVTVAMLALGLASGAAFYVASQTAQRRRLSEALLQVPALLAIGAGVSLSNAVGVVEALVGRRSDFVRTPKYGDGRRRGHGAPTRRVLICVLELAMGLYMLECLRTAVVERHAWFAAPLLALFAAGYFYVGFASLCPRWRAARPAEVTTSVAPAGAN